MPLGVEEAFNDDGPGPADVVHPGISLEQAPLREIQAQPGDDEQDDDDKQNRKIERQPHRRQDIPDHQEGFRQIVGRPVHELEHRDEQHDPNALRHPGHEGQHQIKPRVRQAAEGGEEAHHVTGLASMGKGPRRSGAESQRIPVFLQRQAEPLGEGTIAAAVTVFEENACILIDDAFCRKPPPEHGSIGPFQECPHSRDTDEPWRHQRERVVMAVEETVCDARDGRRESRESRVFLLAHAPLVDVEAVDSKEA